MTYAYSRLWLGILGVGSLVTFSSVALLFQLPQAWLSHSNQFGAGEVWELAFLLGGYALLLLPFDFLGGYWFPRRFEKSRDSLKQWMLRYVPAALGHSLFFLIMGCLLVNWTQSYGVYGSFLAVVAGMGSSLLLRYLIIRVQESFADQESPELASASKVVREWGIRIPKLTVAAHRDVGFTGGIILSAGPPRVVIPAEWLELPVRQLAVLIARRALAIYNGAFWKGQAVAFSWNLGGFVLCSLLPQAGLTTVAELVATICWFTLWSFAGLLVLPTLSRWASLQMDRELLAVGVSSQEVVSASTALDERQDNQPERPASIEAIFHPIPGVNRRIRNLPRGNLSAWNVARSTLFLSWGCLGLLSRAVHCNVGRPELWAMPPSE
ncbi:MAG: hypothetical protein VX768_04190 [Planctomycetota bacterium]|nr:hypothetical protein [Planctomycetota bacterium]